MSGWTSGSYVLGAAPKPTRRITTSPTEIGHLVIAYLVLTFDITLVQRGLGLLGTGSSTAGLEYSVAVAAAVAATGFVAHELAHKIVAQRFGFWAEFRMSPFGLLLSVMTAFVGFLFALPGATMIGGMGDARQWGKTSVVGPLLNLAEGAVFTSTAAGLFVFAHNSTAAYFFLVLALFNGIFAAFNLVPFGLLDGRKVYRWNRGVWAASFAAALAFVVYAYAVLSLPSVPPF